ELTLKLTEAASSFLVKHGYDEKFGARPLKRAIQKYIEDPLSEKILLAEFAKGDEVEVDLAADGEKLDFRVLSGTPKASERSHPQSDKAAGEATLRRPFCLISLVTCMRTSTKLTTVYMCDA